MAQPVKKSNRAAPASTPAPTPAPAPAPAATKPVPKPAAPKRREEEREERKREEPKAVEKREEKPKTPPAAEPAASTTATALPAARPAPVAGAVTTSTPPYAPDAGTVETPETEMIGRSGPLSFLGVGRPIYAFTEPSAVEPEKPEDLTPYLTALGRVEELRRQGKIGEQVREVGVGRATRRSPYRPAIQPVRVSAKAGREPFIRRPYASQVEMPTAQELDIQVEGAKKMQQVMRDRKLAEDSWLENKKEISRLERQLSAARDPITLDPTKSRAAQMEARAKEMEAISRQLKQMAAKQRGLTERLATQNATLREYGMTDEELGLTPKK